MPAIADLPHILAALNGTTAILLTIGWVFIRRGDRARHKAMMVSALVCSALFLAIYLIYHANAGLAKFGGQGIIRPIYFTILIGHVLLSMAITVLVPTTVFLSLTGRLERHRRWARWTLPIWLYVSVSGIVVYVMAIHLYPLALAPLGKG